ncbi:protein ENHANCED DISEASE RESISTANCE 2-like [Dorcoceras hygrometricum]|uniref:Protein ENHANCED DISEASE RESISTANCE 2-like n=1 Tax=Dorcoceras hygrometricum TaxID=472368 RepID=A0A2Z7AHV2_9LAMI|nr:protein ENHANCED DISEASE RESISTANCE 2-like [Dorcoceras hygrometricum]
MGFRILVEVGLGLGIKDRSRVDHLGSVSGLCEVLFGNWSRGKWAVGRVEVKGDPDWLFGSRCFKIILNLPLRHRERDPDPLYVNITPLQFRIHVLFLLRSNQGLLCVILVPHAHHTVEFTTPFTYNTHV